MTALQKLKSASVQSLNFIAGRELRTTFGSLTEEETNTERKGDLPKVAQQFSGEICARTQDFLTPGSGILSELH